MKMSPFYFFYIILAASVAYLFIGIGIYSWKHPEKTDRQIYIDLFNGKIFKEVGFWNR